MNTAVTPSTDLQDILEALRQHKGMLEGIPTTDSIRGKIGDYWEECSTSISGSIKVEISFTIPSFNYWLYPNNYVEVSLKTEYTALGTTLEDFSMALPEDTDYSILTYGGDTQSLGIKKHSPAVLDDLSYAGDGVSGPITVEDVEAFIKDTQHLLSGISHLLMQKWKAMSASNLKLTYSGEDMCIWEEQRGDVFYTVRIMEDGLSYYTLYGHAHLEIGDTMERIRLASTHRSIRLYDVCPDKEPSILGEVMQEVEARARDSLALMRAYFS